MNGAPDTVLPLCEQSHSADAEAQVEAMAAHGLRVLAVASGPTSTGHTDVAAADIATLEHRLQLLGLVGLQDPPREGVAHAVAACREAHIRLVVITGDQPGTARAIAEQVSVAQPDSPVLTSAELPADETALGEMVDVDGVVIARATPEDKLRIARALRARGHIVAMTGDGVNDGPALREADIGVAMGRSGTDVAREAADLVLLDDHFATIVTAIRYGRATFANIRRFLTYHLTDNVAELAPFVFWALSAGGGARRRRPACWRRRPERRSPPSCSASWPMPLPVAANADRLAGGPGAATGCCCGRLPWKWCCLRCSLAWRRSRSYSVAPCLRS